MKMRKGNLEVEVKDFLVNLYKRQGYEEVVEKPEEPKATPKKTTRRTTKKTQ